MWQLWYYMGALLEIIQQRRDIDITLISCLSLEILFQLLLDAWSYECYWSLYKLFWFLFLYSLCVTINISHLVLPGFISCLICNSWFSFHGIYQINMTNLVIVTTSHFSIRAATMGLMSSTSSVDILAPRVGEILILSQTRWDRKVLRILLRITWNLKLLMV